MILLILKLLRLLKKKPATVGVVVILSIIIVCLHDLIGSGLTELGKTLFVKPPIATQPQTAQSQSAESATRWECKKKLASNSSDFAGPGVQNLVVTWSLPPAEIKDGWQVEPTDFVVKDAITENEPGVHLKCENTDVAVQDNVVTLTADFTNPSNINLKCTVRADVMLSRIVSVKDFNKHNVCPSSLHP